MSISAHIRAQLDEAGWRSGQQITVLTDGEPGLANHIRWAVDGKVMHILDWWHISMRIKHVENAVRGLHELVVRRKGADKLPWLAERLRWLVWPGKTGKALKQKSVNLYHLTLPEIQDFGRVKRCSVLQIKRISL